MNIGHRIRFWDKRNILDPCNFLKLLYALVTRASFVMRTRRCYRLTPLFLPILTIYTLMGVTAENSEIFWNSWMNPTGDVPQYCDVFSNVKAMWKQCFFHKTTIMLIGCRRSSPKSITFAAFGGIWLRRHASWLVLTGSRCDVRLETLCGWIEYTLWARLSPLSQQLQISKISRDLCSRCVVVDGLAEFRSQHCYESFSRAALFL